MRAISMNKCVIAVGSVTQAMKGQDVLSHRGIRTGIVKLKAGQTRHGCAYGIEVDCIYMAAAMRILDLAGVPYTEAVDQNS